MSSPLKQMGTETFQEAQEALKSMLLKYPILRSLVEETTIPFKPDDRKYRWACPKCTGGILHVVGKNLVNGKPVPGGMVVCDYCGYHQRLR